MLTSNKARYKSKRQQINTTNYGTVIIIVNAFSLLKTRLVTPANKNSTTFGHQCHSNLFTESVAV